jgi:hypothetical protein
MNGIFVLKSPITINLNGACYIVSGYSLIQDKRYADAEVIKGRARYNLRDDSWVIREKLGRMIA